jgi:predicted DNA binding CopG/RHH family protein
MRNEIKTGKIVEGTFGRLQEIEDFLPRPEELVFRRKGVKVTLTLSEDSLSYFKEQGERLHTPYQRMIRNLLDEYVRQMRRQEQDGKV